MTGSWIKVRHCLWTHPRVVTLASRLRDGTVAPALRSCDAGVALACVIGALARAWCIADAHADGDGVVPMSGAALDQIVGIDGFAQAMESVGWLVLRSDGSAQFPNYQEHNGPTAKLRASGQKRMRSLRGRDGRVAPTLRGKRTREEKNREEDNTPQPPLQGGTKNGAAHAPEQPTNGAPARTRRARRDKAAEREEALDQHLPTDAATGGDS